MQSPAVLLTISICFCFTIHQAAGSAGHSEEEQLGRNQAALDVLLRLPGVSVHNYRALMHHAGSIAEVTALTREQLHEAIGKVNGDKLYDFFHHNPTL